MTVLNVGVVGSRNYPYPEAVRLFIQRLAEKLGPDKVLIISGGARGVDSIAVEEAKRCHIPTKVYRAQWDKYGKRAGFMRNTDIAKDCDRLVAFHDGVSRGTMDTVEKARAMGKPVSIFGLPK